MEIRIAGTAKNSIVDGPGIRYTIFAQGCSRNCEDCHNPHTHDFSGGIVADTAEIASEIKKDPLLSGVTFSGGEPFEQIEAFYSLACLLGDMNIICYTGFDFEELYKNPQARKLLERIDILIDGHFNKTQKSLELRFKGSKNQRILNSKESVKAGEAVEIDI
jgi:anaerobic ribonucleoside-triphosphate reductase activating protein